MKLIDIITMSFGNLVRRKKRTLLTMLGVIIGTVSVVTMLSLSIGAKKTLLAQDSTNIREITIAYSGDEMNKFLTDSKLSEYESLSFVESINPVLSARMQIVAGRWIYYVNLYGLDEEALNNIPIDERGRAIDCSNNEMEIILGNAVGEVGIDKYTNEVVYGDVDPSISDVNFLEDDLEWQIYSELLKVSDDGDISVDVLKTSFPVVGIVNGGLGMYNEYSWDAYTDINHMKDFLRKNYKNEPIPGQPFDKNGKQLNEWAYETVKIVVTDTKNISDYMSFFREQGYTVSGNLASLQETNKIFKIVDAVLLGIGSIALLVSAIGIANTMTMSIYERTKEIGVMKVLGCRLSDINTMFLIEAAEIGFFGGTVGVGLSYLISIAINYIVKNYTSLEIGEGNAISVVSVTLVVGSIIFATIIGVISGMSPAKRATKLSALNAIRNE